MSEETRLCRLGLMHLINKPDELLKALKQMAIDIEKERNCIKENVTTPSSMINKTNQPNNN